MAKEGAPRLYGTKSDSWAQALRYTKLAAERSWQYQLDLELASKEAGSVRFEVRIGCATRLASLYVKF